MKCDHCGQKATVHFTDRQQGRLVEKHLCDSCCQEKEGLSFVSVPPEETGITMGGARLVRRTVFRFATPQARERLIGRGQTLM